MKLNPGYKFPGMLLCLLMITAFLPSFAGSSEDQLFEKGNAAYAKGRYTDAISSYRQIVDRGYESAAVYFNLGNAYYKSDDNTRALLYYEKALKLSPRDEDIFISLQFARRKTADKIEEAPQFFITRWWYAFILALPLPVLAILSVLFILLSSAALITYLFAGSVKLKKTAFYSGLFLFCTGLIFIFMANRTSSYFRSHREAIIFTNSVLVKSAPGVSAKNLFVLHDGTKVSVIGNRDGWMKIRLPNGNEGWIAVSDAREI